MSRRGENIYKRKDGRWEGRYISAYGADGKAKYSYVYAKSYGEVKTKLSQEKNAGKRRDSKAKSMENRSFDSWLTEWLEKKKLTVKESTYIRYRNIIDKHIRPSLGNYPIGMINTEIAERYVSNGLKEGRLDGRGGLSVKTMADIAAVIKETFRYAAHMGADISCCFERIAIKNISHEMRVLNVSEENRLISVLTDDMDRYKLGIYLCLFTGIRVGELCALQWKNISFSDQTLKIEKTLQRLQYESAQEVGKTRIIMTEPKSFAAVRTIPLPGFLLETLRPFEGSPDSYFLSGSRDQYIEPRTMQNRFKKYLWEGGIAEANFHSLRHTFATRCVEMNFDIKTLSEILGHSSVKITLDKYVHSTLEQKRVNMEKLSPMAPHSPSEI